MNEPPKGPFIIMCEGKPGVRHDDYREAVRIAVHMATSNHCPVSIYSLVKSIRVESKVITEDENGDITETTI